MRYLKMYAQDDHDNNVIDAVYLEFYQAGETRPQHEAVVFNLAGDDAGELKWVLADDIDNGEIHAVDARLAGDLARQFLAFDWFALDKPFDKYLEVTAAHRVERPLSGEVRLRFYEGEGQLTEERTFDSRPGCGVLFGDPLLDKMWQDEQNKDVVGKDVQLARNLCKSYLQLNWS